MNFNEIYEDVNDFIEEIRKFDYDTYNHCQRVGEAAFLLAKEMGQPTNYCNDIKVAGYIHDVGKLKISLSVINKNGSLSDLERSEMNHHVTYGAGIVKTLSDFKPIYLEACAEHHAYYDNKDKGYYSATLDNFTKPSLTGQIIAVCDVYDALTHKRAYKAEFSKEKVMSIMNACLIEGQFNPDIYQTFMEKVVPLLEAQQALEKEDLVVTNNYKKE